MLRSLLCVAFATLLLLPSAARAQDDDEPPIPETEDPLPGGDIPQDDEEEKDDTAMEDPTAAEDAVTADTLAGRVQVKAHRYTKADYPSELIVRPMTLPRLMLELRLDVPTILNPDALWMTQVLSAALGITQDLEVGASINAGFQLLTAAEEPTSEYDFGAFSLDGGYTVWPQKVAARASLAFYTNPDFFSMGLNLGVPFRFPITDQFAVIGGHNLFEFRIMKMPVDLADPASNWFFSVEDAEGRTPDLPVGNLNVNIGGLYQVDPKLALTVMFTQTWLDFGDDESPTALFFGATYARAKAYDFGARLGFADLAAADESFSIALFAAYRI